MAGGHILSLTKGAQRAGGTGSWFRGPRGLLPIRRDTAGAAALWGAPTTQRRRWGGGRALGEVEKASTGERTGNGRPGTCG